MSRRYHTPGRRNGYRHGSSALPLTAVGQGFAALVVLLVVIALWRIILGCIILALVVFLCFRYRREIIYLLGRFFRWARNAAATLVDWCRSRRGRRDG